MSSLALVPGPLHPDLFDGVTPIMVEPPPLREGDSVAVPPEIARCPACGASLTAVVEEIVRLDIDGGNAWPETVMIRCASGHVPGAWRSLRLRRRWEQVTQCVTDWLYTHHELEMPS